MGDMLTASIVSTRITPMSEQKYIHEQHMVHHIPYHVIFCPKRRRKVLGGPVRDRFEQIAQDVVQEQSWQIVELAIQPNQVHLFIQANPSTLPLDIARLGKSCSSHLMREEFPHFRRLLSLWTRSAFSSAAGGVSQNIISASIQR